MIFKCKMCGGTLDVKEGQSIAECEFCGTKQTIPVIDNEKSFNLHNRANALRLRNEFDKAIIVYENILTDNPDDAEAHWGLLLCKYGIEYVDDPLTGKKIPTCHRTQFDSVFSDPDYKAAIKNADVLAREVYETEAKEIDGIQKHILEISQKEERFDVFICYKESDENGRRTIDSVIAQDLYSALTQKGYKVFFSKITLETKLGEMYEPYIFAALNSAKVMLVIGTKEAYFNAVWVRNEWSRFIKIMERDHDKYLIPCYKDMDAYDLPMEMASFQAQDMGKIGFLQDLLYGIDKLFGKTARPVKVEEKPTAVIQNGVNYSALLERAQILIEDGDTKKADSLLEKVLNNDPKNAKAYFYKLLIDLNVKSADELNNFTRRISDEPNYIKACRYADAAMKAELDGYSSRIEENVKRPIDCIGQIVEFGRDIQNPESKIQWKVYDIVDDKALLICNRSVGLFVYQAHGSEYFFSTAVAKYVKWEDFPIRKWLNTEFYPRAFSLEEQNKMVATEVEGVVKYVEAGFYDTRLRKMNSRTQDKIFLLNAAEYAKYSPKFSMGILRDGLITTVSRQYSGISYTDYYISPACATGKDLKMLLHNNTYNVYPAMWIDLLTAEERRQKVLKAAEEKRQEEILKKKRRDKGVCQHCGGEFKGWIIKKCSICGKRKDY